MRGCTSTLSPRSVESTSRRTYLSGCEHPLTAFIELRADGIPAFANPMRVDHADSHTAGSSHQESRHPESHHRMAPGHKAIQLFWRMSLASRRGIESVGAGAAGVGADVSGRT